MANVLFWNVYGFSNFIELLRDEFDNNNTIYCLCETWLPDMSNYRAFLNKYTVIISPAKREDNTKGRFSGGLAMIFNKNSFQYTIVFQNDYILMVKFDFCGKSFLVCLVYVSPLIDLAPAFIQLNNALTLSNVNFKFLPLYIGGDCNARVGEKNELDEDFITSPFLKAKRNSLDKKLLKRGKELLDFMESELFVLLNGRTRSDDPADFTYVGPRGRSVIDLVWSNLPGLDHVIDLTVLHDVFYSDHFPVQVKVTFQNLSTNYNPTKLHGKRSAKKLKWQEKDTLLYEIAIEKNQTLTNFSNDINVLNHTLTNAIYTAASEAGMLKQLPSLGSLRGGQPWFDSHCRKKKQEVRLALRQGKKAGFDSVSVARYVQQKTEYKTFLREKKESYHVNLIDNIVLSLASARNSTDFWSNINRIKPKKHFVNSISLPSWHDYLKSLFSCNVNIDKLLLNIENVILDAEFSYSELTDTLKRCGRNKSPGSDGISFEFFVNLPTNWRCFMLQMFNEIYSSGYVPNTWSEIIAIMLYKKGDVGIPQNYRSIALINCETKLFTQMLCSRLNKWAIIEDKMPEFQAGFRAGRGCIDNVFALNATIQIHLRSPGSKVFALFVDFRRAFDGVIHNHLWSKLSSMGVSDKFIRILIDLYRNATIRVRDNDDLSQPVTVERGVLQGEVLSPTLFSLLIADLESFLRDKNCRGISVNSTTDILALAYADDVVLLADSPHMLQRTLKALSEYCSRNYLSVNEQKTEIVIFRKNGHRLSANIPDFYFDNFKLKIVKEYCYLGIVFSNTAKFKAEFFKVATSARTATGAIKYLLNKINGGQWHTLLKLYDSLLVSLLLYCAQVWSYDLISDLDKIQSRFFKNVLNLPMNTPCYAIRLETGCPSLSYNVLKMAISWTRKILLMPDTRFAKICFARLKELHVQGQNSYFSNWYSQVYDLFDRAGLPHVWRETSLESLNLSEETALFNIAKWQYCLDLENLFESNSLQLLPNLELPTASQSYLFSDMTLFAKSIYCQIRLFNNYNPRIITKTVSVLALRERFCPCCNVPVTEDLKHFLTECVAYDVLREEIFGGFLPSDEDWLALLSKANSHNASLVTEFSIRALNLRTEKLNPG